jgi:hypothetical protein
MKYQPGDLVRKNDAEEDNGSLYRVVAIRTYEPCCQLQRHGNPASKHWAITEELELVSRKSVQEQVPFTKQAAR